MVDEDQTPEWWKSTLTAAWFETRMEADRTMVALSAGGIGLMVTLLTTVGVKGRWAALFYTAALVGFVAAIVVGLAIFKVNAAHIAEAADDPEKADASPLRPRLRRLDWALIGSFGSGVLFSILVGIATATTPDPTVPGTHPTEQGEAFDGGEEAGAPADTTEQDAVREEELRGAYQPAPDTADGI
ncbi:MAG: hypothetical protein WEB88_08740 [Gemmatimonadota bacterium]